MAIIYRTVQLDLWDKIAKKFWGDETRMHVLIAANPLQNDTVVFEAGVTLTIPDLPTSTNVVATSPTGRQVIRLA